MFYTECHLHAKDSFFFNLIIYLTVSGLSCGVGFSLVVAHGL